MIVYMIKNKITNKIYIGVTKGTLKRRILTHFANARKGRPELLYNSIRKYGQENFEVTHIASSFDVESLYETEKQLISQFNSLMPYGYNMNIGGEGSRGLKMTDEQRNRISEGLKNRYKNMTDEERLTLSQKISDAKKGMTPLPHMYENKNLGCKRSEEFKEKVSKSMSAYASSHPEEMSRRAKSQKQV